jgi:cell division septation protein DedD
VTTQLERRLSARKTLSQPGHIGPDHGATVLNVSEGGLGFHAVPPVKQSRLVPFWFSANSSLIAGCGELVWIDKAKKTGGIRFTQLSASTHDQIRSWLNESDRRVGSSEDAAARASITNGTDTDPELSSDASPNPEIPWPETSRYALLSPEKSSFEKPDRRSLKAISVSVLAIIIAILLLRDAGWGPLSRARTFGKSRPHAVAPVGDVSARESTVDDAPTQVAPEQWITPTPSAALFGLQVGAFAQEANAEKLAESLRQQNFPAFITSSVDGALNLVHVGPYADEKSARIAQDGLRRAGFNSFLHRSKTGKPTDP